jgi:transposase, IS5 family
MKQLGFFDFDMRLNHINKAGDPLAQFNDTVDWEVFRSTLAEARKKPKISKAGTKGFDVVLLFKILILQSLYNLTDKALEFQILDRYSFSRFLGLHAASKVPDATTIWRFREDSLKIFAISLFHLMNLKNITKATASLKQELTSHRDF